MMINPEKLKGGPLARLAGMWMNSGSFQEYANRNIGLSNFPQCANPPERANEYIKRICGIESKKELDHNSKAADKFHRYIRRPYIAHMNMKARNYKKL